MKISINQNKKVEQQLRQPLHNYDKIYRDINIQFKEDRNLHIRWIKLPTFINREGKPNYYAIFLNDINYWRKGEIKQLQQQCLESIDRYDVDSHIIFQTGQLYGHFNPIENINMKYYKTFILNTDNITTKQEHLIYKTICNILNFRCNKIENGGKIIGVLEQDVKRLRNLVETLSVIHSYNIIRNNVIRTSNSSYNILQEREGDATNVV